MATAATRQYPRLRIEMTGALAVRVSSDVPSRFGVVPRSAPPSELVRVPVAIRSISCEGAGVAFLQERVPVSRGASVTLHFVAEARRFELPGRVAWALASRPSAAPMDLGLHFQLDIAGQHTRQAWGLWIVSLIAAVRDPVIAPRRRS